MAFTPDQEQMIQLMFEEQTAELRRQNDQLRQQLAILSDGSSISRSDYQALQDRLRQEQDKNFSLTRQLQDMESRMNSAIYKAQQLTQQINQNNDSITNDIKRMQSKEAEIASLKDQIQKLEQNISKQRLELTDMLDEKNQMAQTIKDYEQVNIQLQEIVQQLLEKHKEITESYTETAELLTRKDEEIDSLKRRIDKMKLRIVQHKEEGNSTNSQKDNTEINISQFEAPPESFTMSDETREAVNKVKQQNEEMKKQMDKFNDNKKLIEQLQKALESKSKQVENLQNLLDEEEKKTLEYKHTTRQFNLEITKLHDQMRAAEEVSELKISTLKQEMETYKSQNEQSFQKRDMLEREVIEMTRELNELRKLSRDIENGQFGLCDAIDQLKELKAMVNLRDQHIAVLVRELNAMDKMIDGLAIYLGPDFDAEKFIQSVEDDIKNNNEKRMINDIAKENIKNQLLSLQSTFWIYDIPKIQDQLNFDPSINKKVTCAHAIKSTYGEPAPYGNPFVIFAIKGEKFSDTKKRFKAIMKLSDGQFNHLRFFLNVYEKNQNFPLNDDDELFDLYHFNDDVYIMGPPKTKKEPAEQGIKFFEKKENK